MPPEANKAKAPHLTAEQLDILKRWINEGAQGTPRARKAVAWNAMPQNVVGVSAIALSPDGQFAAAGRGSGVALYNLSIHREAGRFDAHLEGLAGHHAPGHEDLQHRGEIVDTLQRLLVAALTGGAELAAARPPRRCFPTTQKHQRPDREQHTR
jgi:hypothetical protein